MDFLNSIYNGEAADSQEAMDFFNSTFIESRGTDGQEAMDFLERCFVTSYKEEEIYAEWPIVVCSRPGVR